MAKATAKAADGALVDVQYAAGEYTTDVYLSKSLIKFVDGAASVTQEQASELKENGLIK